MSTVDDIAGKFDKILLGMVEKGTRQVVAGDQVVDVDLTAADLGVIRSRLRDCGVTVPENRQNTTDDLARAMSGLTSPDIAEVEDDPDEGV